MDINKIEIISVNKIEDIEKVIYLHKTIWGLDNIEVTPSHIYIATNHAGGHLLLAFVNEKPVGYLYGFPGVDAKQDPYFYIHNIGVLKQYRSLGIGMQLMLELRERLIETGYSLVTWTYDPLETLNASLYVGKLGGITNHYIEDYYGEMNDEINIGFPSDRLILYWHIKSEHVTETLKHTVKKNSIEIDSNLCFNAIDANHCPVDSPVKPGGQKYYLQSPVNLHDLRQQSKDAVYQWRMNLRKHMQTAFSEGLFITDTIYVNNSFYYLLSKPH